MVALRDTATLAEQAYVFGYPLVLSARSMEQAAAVNQFVHGRDTPDTVHSSAWVDLGDEPIVLSVSPARGRYYVLWLHDAWNALFASLGPRTTGAEPRTFALLGPGRHRDPLPPGVTPIACPTRIVHLTGRLEAVGEREEDALRWAREGFELTPLSGHRHDRRRSTDAIDLAPPVEQVERLDGHSFFSEVTRLAVDNPPGPVGSAMLDRLLELATAPEAVGDVERGVFRGRAAVRTEARQAVGEPIGPWRVFYDSGRDRLRLAGAARAGLETDATADALRAVLDRDAADLPLTGRSRYVLRFAPDAPPPVHGFWSLTTRAGAEGGAHSISDLRGLTLDADGSLTIHIQQVAPRRGRRSNWLPAPAGRFDLTLDLYWPGEAALQRRWLPPALTRVE